MNTKKVLIEKKREYGDFKPFLDKEKHFKDAIHELETFHQKQNHWIWFLFPNLEKHGQSYYSKYFGLYDENEAELFYKNDILRKRLITLFEIINELLDKHPIKFIMNNETDKMKFLSCMDLFYPLLKKEEEQQLFMYIKKKIL